MSETAPTPEAVAATERALRVTRLSAVDSRGVLDSGRDFSAEGQKREELLQGDNLVPTSYTGRVGRAELNFPTPVTVGYVRAEGLTHWRGGVNKDEFDRMLENVGDTADFIVAKLNEILRGDNGGS